MFLIKWWRGDSGRIYSFKILYGKKRIPDHQGGIYIFVKRRFLIFPKILYIGKATNFRERLLGHEKWPRAFWMGATERHLHYIDTDVERSYVEEDLIRRYNPPINKMMVISEGEVKRGFIHKRPKKGLLGFA
jgi:excinuclease UvrABC nuclease subunit